MQIIGDGMTAAGDIVRTVLGHYPDTQAIYRLIKTRKLGLPQDSKENFSLLQRAGLIDEAMSAAFGRWSGSVTSWYTSIRCRIATS